MPTIPPQSPAQQRSLDALRREYPGWTIEPPGALHVWTAERHDGHAVRFLAAHDPAELLARLVTATKVAP